MIPTTYPDDTEWTVADDNAAMAEGWNLWDCGGSGNGRTQLCRYDDTEEFPQALKFEGGDEFAWDHVVQKAREGSALHLKALTLVAKHNPTEAECIAKRTGWEF